MIHDFAARGLAAQNRFNARRLATLDTLARGIAENLPNGLPGLTASPPEISAPVSASAIASGTLFGFNATTPSSDFRHRFAFYGGDWRFTGSTYPYTVSLAAWQTHLGNGTDPSANEAQGQSGCIRFTTWADKFEVWQAEVYGFRMKVNGEYVRQGVIGNSPLDGVPANSSVYILFDFGGSGLKQVEIEYDAGLCHFRGIRVPSAYTVEPWAAPDALRMSVWSDSLADTVVDPSDHRLARIGMMPQVIRALTGQPDLWVQASGATGFLNDKSGTRSTFVERAGVDFPAYGPFDVVIDIGGRNDSTPDETAADAFQQAVEDWIDIVLASNQDTIICMTGPQSSTGTEAYSTNTNGLATKQDRKKAAAAKYPRNCLFIETIGNAGNPDPWINGNGKVGSSGSTAGNADRLSGDYVHRSIQGHVEIGTRIVQEIARRLPLLASRIRDGVIAGVNDADLV